MGADKQAKSALERNSAVAKIKQDLAWRSAIESTGPVFARIRDCVGCGCFL